MPARAEGWKDATQAVDNEGVDVSNRPGSYVWGRDVASGCDGGEACIQEGGDGAMLGRVDFAALQGRGFRESNEQVGQQQVLMNQFLRFGDDGWGHLHFFIDETHLFCAKQTFREQTLYIESMHTA